MAKQSKKRKPSVPARFMIGDRVRVRRGVVDADHPDMPLGGWKGTILAVQRGRKYLIRWTEETLANIHPIYKQRAAIEDKVVDEYRLAEGNLEPDLDEPLAIEQPTQIVPRPLSTRKRDDRIRAIFGLTSDDFLPAVKPETLKTYREQLNAYLSLPAEAWHFRHGGDAGVIQLRDVEVLTLETTIYRGKEVDILCKAISTDGQELIPLTELRFPHSGSNQRLVEDFADWLDFDEWTHAAAEWADEDDIDDVEDPPEQATWSQVGKLALEALVVAVLLGAMVGSAVAVMPWAVWTVAIAGCIGSVVFVLAHAPFQGHETSDAERLLPKGGPTMLGALCGSIMGMYMGALAAAFVGALLGGAAGFIIFRIFRTEKLADFQILPGPPLIVAGLGGVAQAFFLNGPAALDGLIFGIGIGLAGMALLLAATFALAYVMTRR